MPRRGVEESLGLNNSPPDKEGLGEVEFTRIHHIVRRFCMTQQIESNVVPAFGVSLFYEVATHLNLGFRAAWASSGRDTLLRRGA